MEYTKHEIVTISIATFDASFYLETAHELLLNFIEDFFMTTTLDELISAAKNNPGRLVATTTAISEFLSKARAELDTFGNSEHSPVLSHLLYDAKEKQNIINTYLGKPSA